MENMTNQDTQTEMRKAGYDNYFGQRKVLPTFIVENKRPGIPDNLKGTYIDYEDYENHQDFQNKKLHERLKADEVDFIERLYKKIVDKVRKENTLENQQYALAKLEYLKECRLHLFFEYCKEEKRFVKYLLEIEALCCQSEKMLAEKMAESWSLTNELKQNDPKKWLVLRNKLQQDIENKIKTGYIYYS